LAARWRVPLHGIFVEDEELACLTGLPFACQVTLAAGREPLTKNHVEDHFRAFAERARRDLAAAAAQHGVDWSFEVVPGPLAANALGSAEHDFVVASAATRPIGSHFRVASRWWSSVAIIARPSCWRGANGRPADRSSLSFAVAVPNRCERSISLRKSPASVAAC
jgi:hypothetical protein